MKNKFFLILSIFGLVFTCLFLALFILYKDVTFIKSLISILIAYFILYASICIHELGHYFEAKKRKFIIIDFKWYSNVFVNFNRDNDRENIAKDAKKVAWAGPRNNLILLILSFALIFIVNKLFIDIFNIEYLAYINLYLSLSCSMNLYLFGDNMRQKKGLDGMHIKERSIGKVTLYEHKGISKLIDPNNNLLPPNQNSNGYREGLFFSKVNNLEDGYIKINNKFYEVEFNQVIVPKKKFWNL
ncbi:zinc metalloprotease [Rummeliibacillus pycnus]|uniref:hypothetical protein n=1 Tax=Rummeliibacillus pycnus TaxID=101070 RepID=UPI000C9D1A68|nr:hypothetical protein [Rummeliibacillus pycnus]